MILNPIKDWCDMKCSVSSINPGVVFDGPPYCVVGMICKDISGASYIPQSADNHIISAVQLVICENVYLV